MSRINKPTHNNLKSSDRRLAAGSQPSKYLHSNISNNLNLTETLNKNANNTANSDTDSDNITNYKLFIGNLGPEVNEELVFKSFQKYSNSIVKIEIPKSDKKKLNSINKGFGFITFNNSNDYLLAFKELNNKYIGSRPIILKNSNFNLSKSNKNDSNISNKPLNKINKNKKKIINKKKPLV
ncbi:unnamed protein product [[Candida] boidinii]|uniref:Unnamed protein product n=1 Tax=Candida boidinii TaxID=5477 RepID=A0A9W6WCP0_CANBO|nr:organic cyclic compound binding protein [[Candida] boidinii]OWB86182.1 organic cyclic compound binding protein [[Candida] boidinii]GME77715.1 unnamed protein product [[Candida] boidinii]